MSSHRYDRLQKARYALLAGMFALGCSSSHGPSPNGQTHWLRECRSDKECGALSCICGVCSATCKNADACKSAVGEDAVCKPAASSGECTGSTRQKLICVAECSRDSECAARGPNLACSSGVCKLSSKKVDAGSGDSGVERTFDAGRSDLDASQRPLEPNDLTCMNGSPLHLPAGVSVSASDISWMDFFVSNDVLTWTPLKATKILHQSLQSTGAPATVELGSEVFVASPGALAADGADAVIVANGAGVPTTAKEFAVRLVPAQGSAVNLAIESGSTLGHLLMDADSVYWMQIDRGTLTTWRSPRKPGTSTSLGALPSAYSEKDTTNANAHGPVIIGDWVYVATSASDKGQLLRALKDGSTQLTAFGPELSYVDAIATDGTDLLLLLEPQLDMLRNPIKAARIIRMSSTGTVTDVTEIPEIGDDLSAGTDRISWTSHDMTGGGSVWSVAADGSDGPVEEVHVLAGFAPRVFSSQKDIYFAIKCPDSRGHIMRLRR